MRAGSTGQQQKAAEYQAGRGITRMPNFSAAVSAQRFESDDPFDDFPTPPWCGRAWVYRVIGARALKGRTIWEPAANRGYLVRGLTCVPAQILKSDVKDYGVGFPIFDFLSLGDTLLPSSRPAFTPEKPDWIVTNPPFKNLIDFILIALAHARIGVAMFCRTQAMEGGERYDEVFGPLGNRWLFSVFSERGNLVRGTVDPNASRPASYGWLTIRHRPFTPEFIVARRHIPPCRDRLERPGDYDEPTAPGPLLTVMGAA